MFGRAFKQLCLLLLLMAMTVSQEDECSAGFMPGSVCPLDIDNVIDIDGHAMDTEQECQYSCFRDDSCTFFTFFKKDELKKCVLFRDCPETTPCRSCFTGPAMPSLADCKKKNVTLSSENSNTTTAVPELADITLPPGSRETLEVSRPEKISSPLTTDEATGTEKSFSISSDSTNSQQKKVGGEREPKQLEEEEEETTEGTTKEDDNSTMSVQGVDEGLLKGEEDPVDLPKPEKEEVDEEEDEEDEKEEAFPDDYFDEQQQSDNNNSNATAASNGTEHRGPPAFFHCVMGGYGPRGPIPTVSHVIPSRPRLPRLIPPLPPSFPLGLEGTYSSLLEGKVIACSPGTTSATANGFIPSSFASSSPLQSGRCMSLSNTVEGWQPLGSPMNAYRGGGALTRMGKFIVATGGHSFPSSLNSIEVLNLDNPVRWRTLSKLSLPNPTFDHCVVAVNKTSVFMTGGIGQESQAVMLDLKDKRWQTMQPMKQPRRKHSCTKAKVNGRDGVIVAGGASDAIPALASLEFYDIEEDNWLSLGRMREGRRFPGIFVLSGNLVVAGGETTDPLGRTVILDSMETLRKKSWRPVKQRLPEPRSRFAVVRIPRTFF